MTYGAWIAKDMNDILNAGSSGENVCYLDGVNEKDIGYIMQLVSRGIIAAAFMANEALKE